MDIEKVYSQGLDFIKQGMYIEASQILTELEQRDLAYYFTLRSRLYLSQNNQPDAEYYIKRAKDKTALKTIKRDFLLAQLQITESQIKFTKGDLKPAIEELESFLDKNPEKSKDFEVFETLEKLKKARENVKTNDKQSEKKEFIRLYQQNYAVTPNSKWYIISSLWLRGWLNYVQATTEELPFAFTISSLSSMSSPGKIDNSDILSKDFMNLLEDDEHPYNSFCLKPGLAEGSDYVLVPEKAFLMLADVYGVVQEIIRYAIEQNDTIYQIEVFLKVINIAYLENNNLVIKKLSTSRKNTIGYIKKLVLRKLNLHIQSRAWKIDLTRLPVERLKMIAAKSFPVYLDGSIIEEDTVIDDAEISECNLLLIETLTSHNKYFYCDDPKILVGKCCFCQCASQKVSCRVCSKKIYCSANCIKSDHSEHKALCKPKKKSFFNFFSCFCRQSANMSDAEDNIPVLSLPSKSSNMNRLVGLHNLGNTCFMNSAIQCLSSTKHLSSFFISGEYSSKINKSNPLGTKGKLATAYAELLHTMQTTTEKAIPPWKLKKTIAMFAPQFLGHQQHDSHELLLFLISGLHEDLNQVTKKPYFNNDIKETNDREMAAESWRRHIARNQSIIVDLMYGQYKSTLHCPKCQKYSYAFDPFNCLSLPIPQNTHKKVNIVFIPYHSFDPVINFTYIIDPGTCVSVLISKVVNYCNKEKLEIVPMSSKESSLITMNKDTKVEEVKSANLFFYELPDEFTEFVIVNIAKEASITLECYPRILGISKANSFIDLHVKVFEFLKQFFGNSSTHETYHSFLSQKAYKLMYDSTKANICMICCESLCQGCEIDPQMKKISGFLKTKNYFSMNLVYSKSLSRKTIDFSSLKKAVQAKITQDSPIRKTISIYDCFSMFSLPEILDKNNLWYCSNCKVHVQASKKLEIYKVPPILIIHLKRFKTHGFYREKLNVPIEFPVKGLDISDHAIGEKPPIYDLYAISNHFGALAGGHYTASVYSEITDKWYNCNDSDVSENRDISEVSSYVLFYKARNME